MKFLLLIIALASVAAPQLGSAGPSVSPYANSELGVILRKDGTTTDCSKKPSKANKRSEKITRQFTQITVDPCIWSDSVNLRDLSVPAKIYRIGADVMCGIEDAFLPKPKAITENLFPSFWKSEGLRT